jgi:branched-chain amino acid aminotransferase
MPAHFINYNGTLLPSGQPVLTADNRGFRYGDGLFETMLIRGGGVRLELYHFDRLFSGMRLLRLEPSFTPEILEKEILDLCGVNGGGKYFRVRLVVFRGDGGLFDPPDSADRYIIQAVPLPAGPGGWNEEGLKVDVFPEGRKSCDHFSRLKSNNYLLYAQAAIYARQQGLGDCLVLNSHGRVADSTIANIFYIRDGVIYTPPLSEGGVAGVMRRYLLEKLPEAGYIVHERPVSVEELSDADEVLLTNAVRGISWVRSFRGIPYTCQLASGFYKQWIENL